MKPAIYILISILYIALVTAKSDCVIDNKSLENSWEYQLHSDLQCNYHISESPKPNGTVDVNMTFALWSFYFTNNEEALSLNGWMKMSWFDNRLRWNPSDYDGINETGMTSTNLWLPGLKLINSANADDQDGHFYASCRVRSDGLVLCIPGVNFESRCNTNIIYWLYDTQFCDIDFGAWPRKETKVKFHFKLLDIKMNLRDKGREWNITDLELGFFSNSELQNRITLILARQSDTLAVVIVHPSIVLSILTITSQFLDIRNKVRLGIICFNLANHFMFLSQIQWFIPKQSVDIPMVLLYYRGSLIVTLSVILITYILSVLCKKNDEPPSWVRTVIGVLKTPWRHIVWPRWECQATGYAEEWINFANIANSLCSMMIIVVYICLFFSFMPTHQYLCK